MRMFFTALALGTLLAGSVLGIEAASQYRAVAVCQEDEVLVGQGAFEHGRFDHYACGPSVDSYTPDDQRVPSCKQDDIIIGGGDYANGRWQWYMCVPIAATRLDTPRP